MKKVFCIALLALLSVACGGNGSAVKDNAVEQTQGEVKDCVVIGKMDMASTIELVTMTSQKSLGLATFDAGAEFRMEWSCPQPSLAALKLNSMPLMPVFVDGPQIIIVGDGGQMKVSGTPANDAYGAMIAELEVIKAGLRAGRYTLEEAMTIGDREQEIIARYYKQHRSDILGAYLLASGMYRNAFTPQQILREIEKYPADLQAMEEVVIMKRNAEGQINTAVGESYINIALPDRSGKNVSLKSILANNRVVLLDFWQSGNMACMREVTFLLRTYGEFHERGFEIYGVGLDSDRDVWESYIESNGMMWVNVTDLKGWDMQAVKEYGVAVAPTNLLIDGKTGRIIARNIRMENIYSTIADIFE